MVRDLSQAVLFLYAQTAGKPFDHEDLLETSKNLFSQITGFKNLSQKDYEEIVFAYEKQYCSKTFEPGKYLTDQKGAESWLYKKKRELENDGDTYQERYKDYLIFNHFGESTADNILLEAEKILAICADPDSNERKIGLVMGDVQSGKTSNYSALVNIACDYGYKVILILAGMTDSLRIQTQDRVDMAVIGAISSSIGNQIEYVGVGKKNQCHYAVPFTTNKKDFEAGNCVANDLSKPVVLVVKKNKAVLEAVKKWLKPGQVNISSKNILIVDDECDNASVNTKTDDDPSAINALIRDIYNNFNCASYVGYTATPFANIFINPERQIGNDDLFPRNFIYRLKADEDQYFGISKVFKDEKVRYLKTLNTDEPNFLPTKHKKTDDFSILPESMKNAICDFLICNCIRTLRGARTKHRSMIINISRFNSMHEQIRYVVENYINNLIDLISQNDKYPIERFIKHPELKRIFDIYQEDAKFTSKNNNSKSLKEEYPFDLIKNSLFDEISQFKTVVVNNRYKGDQRFNYDDYKETGARVITIGGFVLSRGLTLEGLMTSYYNRSSTAYDNLLQMCRWFGYRPGYEDLCSVYLSQVSIDSFRAVVEAIDDIDEQLSTMIAQGKTPKDFGLMIKESPETLETRLIITQRNKMKNSTETIRSLNYSGVAVDTSKIYIDKTTNNHNLIQVKNMYENLSSKGFKIENVGNRHMFVDVDKEVIADLIENIATPLENKKFDRESISEFIRDGEYYDKWGVVFATGDYKGDKFELGDLSINPVQRSFAYEKHENFVRIAKTNNKLVDPGIFNSGLTDAQINYVKEQVKSRNKKNPVSSDYLSVPNRKPLLVILPVKLIQDDKDIKDGDYSDSKQEIINNLGNDFLIGFAVGFAGHDNGVKVKYRMNNVKRDEYFRKKLSNEEDENED